MIVPRYWAESRCKHRDASRQVTIRRFGWSNVSMDDAQSMADERASSAMARELAGEKQNRFEPKVAYKGQKGFPSVRRSLSSETKRSLRGTAMGHAA